METLVQCEFAGACAICCKDTPWKVLGTELHLCSNECYKEADELGLVKVATSRREMTPNTPESGSESRSEAPNDLIQ